MTPQKVKNDNQIMVSHCLHFCSLPRSGSNKQVCIFTYKGHKITAPNLDIYCYARVLRSWEMF
jgi:hypothetical protein